MALYYRFIWLKSIKFNLGSAELARYNPPFVPGFLKRNEVLLEVNYPAE